MKTISIIVAAAEDNSIGRNNDLLWRLPNDMKRFKALTTGHTIIMGRKTFESLPKGALPNRKNIVLTSRPGASYDNAFVFPSLPAAIESCGDQEEIFIIGGGLVYRQAIDIADKLYFTRVHHTYKDADTFFPEIDPEKWEETEREEYPADEKHACPYTFSTYIKRK